MGAARIYPLGAQLKHFRRLAGLSQEALATRAGLSPRGISDLERGVRRAPHPSTLALLAEALGLTQEQRETLYAAALARPGGAQEAPAANTEQDAWPDGSSPSGARHNLRIPLTRLVGRDHEATAVRQLLLRAEVRLVTLTGPAGIGKTCLAQHVAIALVQHFVDGVWFVRLSRLTDHSLVMAAIASTLDLKEVSGKPLAEVVRAYLRDKHLLLVLDNFEHVVEAAVDVADLLASSPGLKVLVTSRAALHVRGETDYLVPPLDFPSPAETERLSAPDQLTQYSALALFVQRVRASKPSFRLTDANAHVIAAICTRLDGLPLAIELAAARVRLLPPSALLKRLERPLPLLVGGPRDVEARQQTMRNTLTWSYDLLPPQEQRLFRRLAVFVGGCTLEAAGAICVTPTGAEPLGAELLDGLSRLLEHSLIQQREEAGEPRFGMLQVIREYAIEQLDACGESEVVRNAHLAFYLALGELARTRTLGPNAAIWLAELDAERDNVRAALAWACDCGRTGRRAALELGLRLGATLGPFWFVRRSHHEGRQWLETLLAFMDVPTADGTVPPAWDQANPTLYNARLWATLDCGAFASSEEDRTRAVSLWKEGLAAARAVGNTAAMARALQGLAGAFLNEGNAERGSALYEESLTLARQSGDAHELENVLIDFSYWLLVLNREHERATALAKEALAVAEQTEYPYGETYARYLLALSALRCDDLIQARVLAREALLSAHRNGYAYVVPNCLAALSHIASREGDSVRAAHLLGAAKAMYARDGATPSPAEAAMQEEMTAPARAALGEVTWDAAYAAGSQLSLEDVIAEALAEGK